MIKFEVKGDGYLLRGSPIDKATYEYFKDNNEALEAHVSHDDDENRDDVGKVPEEVTIGLYDDCDHMAIYAAELNNSSLDIDCDGELQTIELSEKNIKKLGIVCKIETITLENYVDEKKGFFFMAYQMVSGSSEDVLEIPEEKIFDPKKLSLTITNLKSDYEAHAITYLEYDGKEIVTQINGSGDLTEFKVVEVG
tara:strand:+ start:49 stop:633 length:585 start_codon:yes stop_codon:yes gene_type:complete